MRDAEKITHSKLAFSFKTVFLGQIQDILSLHSENCWALTLLSYPKLCSHSRTPSLPNSLPLVPNPVLIILWPNILQSWTFLFSSSLIWITISGFKFHNMLLMGSLSLVLPSSNAPTNQHQHDFSNFLISPIVLEIKPKLLSITCTALYHLLAPFQSLSLTKEYLHDLFEMRILDTSICIS